MKKYERKKFIPKSLLGRSLVIVFVPIASLVIITSLNESKLLSEKYFNFKIDLLVNEFLNVKDFKPKKRILDSRLSQALKDLNREFVFDSTNLDSGLKIKIQVGNDILIINVHKDRLYSGRAFVFILWMIFSSIILFLVAYIFMKNQTRPLKKLSIIAETFGRGLDTPVLRPSGSMNNWCLFLSLNRSILSSIEGQYLGLMLFSPTAFEWIDKVLAEKDIDPEKSMMLGTAGFTALQCSFAIKAREELLLGEKVNDVLVT